MGGDFYALSDAQLQHLLEGNWSPAEFLFGERDEKPRECYSGGEHVWYQLTQLLGEYEACGVEQTDAIPEFSGYTFSGDVPAIAAGLAGLDRDGMRVQYDDNDIDAPFDELVDVALEVVAFYQRAAANGDAVLFRVT